MNDRRPIARLAVIDRGETAVRVFNAVGDLNQAGQRPPIAAVLYHRQADALPSYGREADDVQPLFAEGEAPGAAESDRVGPPLLRRIHGPVRSPLSSFAMSTAPTAISASRAQALPPAGSLAMVGLGRMGANMARRLARSGVAVLGVDPDAEARAGLADAPGVVVYATLEEAIAALPAPRTVWLMLPAGAPTQTALDALLALLTPGDLVVDGGNADHRDSRRRAHAFAACGLSLADCGVSGGIWGLDNGYCLMFGADEAAAPRVAALARLLAPATDRGWLHCGPPGAGHFVKMIHNGIEYGAMQAYAEGFALLEGSEYGLDPAQVGELWRHGSVIRSWLLDLVVAALAEPGAIDAVQPFVADSGEGRWTVEEAIRQGTPVPVIALALMCRFDSQGRADTANRLLALMRKGFGGHAVRPR